MGPTMHKHRIKPHLPPNPTPILLTGEDWGASLTPSPSGRAGEGPHAARAQATLQWVRRSIEATGGQGSAHHWSPLWGWAKPYPETTGYLIETLVHYAGLLGEPALADLAMQCARWLQGQQLPGGSFPALLAGSGRPSVFNTAMVLSMAHALPDWCGSEARPQLEAALRYLLRGLSPDGTWQQDAYVPGFVPSYYSYAVWRVLQADQVLRMDGVEEAMSRALSAYAARFLPNGAVRHWGFRPEGAAFTHTIAYTLQGFWEAAQCLARADVAEQTLHSAGRLWAEVQRAGRTAGRYDEHWRGDYSFRCVTGNAQLSVLYRRLWAGCAEPEFLRAADFFLQEILDTQGLGKNPGRCGAVPGSLPLWGPYLRLRYPNWAAKFYLDALSYCCA